MSREATAYLGPDQQLSRVNVRSEQREFVVNGRGGPTLDQIRGHIKLGEPIQPGQQEQFHVTPGGDITTITIGPNQFLSNPGEPAPVQSSGQG